VTKFLDLPMLANGVRVTKERYTYILTSGMGLTKLDKCKHMGIGIANFLLLVWLNWLVVWLRVDERDHKRGRKR
jgi:hypothetical protein